MADQQQPQPPPEPAPPQLMQVLFEIDTATGTIERVERIDPSGARHELSDDECELLAAGRPDDVDDLLELTYLLES